jgi:ubiquinone/menaquinone biosynthesis C-methylase UbiE
LEKNIREKYRLTKIIGADNFLFFNIILLEKRYTKRVLYDKTTGKSKNIIFNLEFHDWGFHNDIDGSIPFWPKGKVSQDILYKNKNIMASNYIHGVTKSEQNRLAELNKIVNDSFMNFLEINPDNKILDIGCGMGNMAKYIAGKYPKTFVYGVDISQEQISNGVIDCSNVKLIRGNANELSFEDNYFDIIYIRFLLEHVADPLNIIYEAYRVLKNGGKIFVQENNITYMIFYPECPKFEKLWLKFAQLQKRLDGDALIGKKLFYLFTHTKFKEIELFLDPEVHYYGKGSFITWIENLIQNIKGAEEKLIQYKFTNKYELELVCKELEDFKHNKYASTYFCWNRLKAVK